MFDNELMNDHEQLRQRAYHIWLAEGQPEGRALDHWFQAKEELTSYKALGTAEYMSWQRGSVVTVQASGVLPGSGFTASLEPNRLEANDPSIGNAFVGYMLVFRRTGAGSSDGHPARFEIRTSFEYRGSVFEILVYDRQGEHRLYPNGPGTALPFHERGSTSGGAPPPTMVQDGETMRAGTNEQLADEVVEFWKREFDPYVKAGGRAALEERPVAKIAHALLGLDSYQSARARELAREYVGRFTGLAITNAPPRRVLLAASESGVWASELTLVAALLLAAGHEVKIATETGQPPHFLSVSCDPEFLDGPLGVHVVSSEEAQLARRFLDPSSAEGRLLAPGNMLSLGELVRPPLVRDYLENADASMRQLREGIEAVVRVQESYDALVIAGGSGAVAGFAMNGSLHHLVLAFHRSRKPVVAECNGVFALSQAIDPMTGASILRGRLATTHSRSHEYWRGGWGWARPNADGTETWVLPGADGNPIIDSEPFVRNTLGPDGMLMSPPETPYAVAVDGHLITARTTPDGAPAAVALIALLADPNAFGGRAFMSDDSGFHKVGAAAESDTRR